MPVVVMGEGSGTIEVESENHHQGKKNAINLLHEKTPWTHRASSK